MILDSANVTEDRIQNCQHGPALRVHVPKPKFQKELPKIYMSTVYCRCDCGLPISAKTEMIWILEDCLHQTHLIGLSYTITDPLF